MIQPFMQDKDFLLEVRSASPDHVNIWWLGQSGIMIGWNRQYLLMDPYLSDSLTRKYAGTDKPHVRLVERVIAPERLDFIHAVTSSHNHTDHLDGETLQELARVNPSLRLIVPRANQAVAAKRIGWNPERLELADADGAPLQVGDFRIWAIPAAHEVLEQDEMGNHKFVGYIVEVAGSVIYHSGDCCWYKGLEDRLVRWKIDLAVLPINGRDPRRGVAGNFNGEEAAILANAVGIGKVIPCHFEMFQFNSVSPQGFRDAAAHLGVPYLILKVGEHFQL